MSGDSRDGAAPAAERGDVVPGALAGPGSSERPASVAPEGAGSSERPASVAPEGAGSSERSAAAAAAERAERPPNKVYEWGAAIAIMVVLTAFLAAITSFLRGASL